MSMDPSRPILEEAACQELLALARSALESYLATGQVPAYQPGNPELRKGGAAFVSLHNGEELRGCIGLLSDEGELYRTVQRCALSAATEDMRFHPVTLDEVPSLCIEISVLSEPQRITDVQLIEVGRHGIIIARGSQRGLLLPQVASKYNWDRPTFLSQTCRKAGLSANAWSKPDTVIQIFEAQVFSE
jgi:AmmeMemoRadiSam system protein A